MQMLAAGQTALAISSVRTHLKFKPRDPAALDLLAMLLMRTGDLAGAAVTSERAVQAEPHAAILRHNHAIILKEMGRFAEAVSQWERAVQLEPSLAPAWTCMSTGYAFLRRPSDALAAARQGLELAPGSAEAAGAVAFSLQQACLMEEAIAMGERAIGFDPMQPLLWSNLLLTSHYVDGPSEGLAKHHRAFGSRFPASAAKRPAHPDPRRPLRVGVLSPDLCDHSVAYFVQSLLETKPQDWTMVAIHTGGVRPKDPVQSRMRSLFQAWHEAAGATDAVLEGALGELQLDVLIELSGHSAGGRLAALARKPAPVMITAIGYPNTTGLPAMDYRVVDSITDPPGSEHFCTERLLRLDPCFLCYTPPQQAPEPAMPAGDAPITFGSFNNANKISCQTAELWGGLMRAVPNSRLLLKAWALADAGVNETILARLEAGGVPRDRVDVVAYAAGRDGHLATYHHVHVALDTVPYNGTTTTCEALWMGVPVITTLGDRHAARVSASLLHAVGHPEWVAKDAADFARLGAALAADRAALSGLRGSLRGQMAASTLCDARAYGERFHAAIRACWANACKDSTNV
jgi:predicted O-linked N-acetylglucosamine transferase (SPINDLY family)